jgi:phytoene dehydrogenase-like protein
MRFDIDVTPVGPKYRECFVVTTSGYWGDMDETHHGVETFSPDEEDKCLAYCHAWTAIYNDECQDFDSEDMDNWLNEQGYEKHDLYLPTDQGCMILSTLETFTIEWYDKDGKCYNVAFVKEN